ncbi:MAG: hypothetical protein IKO57_03405 [Treponema sp.]|nr:hypothetical protein [Treponema sp.]
MKELIDKELSKTKDCFTQQDDGLDDEAYNRLEKMILEEFNEEGFVTTFRHLLKLNNKIGLEVYWQQNLWWEHAADFAAQHIAETINFIKNDCSAEEFISLSEIFDDITEKTKSKEFVDCIEEVAKKFPKECEKYYLQDNIKNCKIIID